MTTCSPSFPESVDTVPLKSDRTVRTSPYRPVLTHATLRRLLPGFTVSSLGDGMAVVAVSWPAIEIAPVAERGMWVALAAAAYMLSGAAGAVLLGRFLRRRSPARLVACDALLRATALGAIPVCHALGVLSIESYVALLALSSVLHAWGQAGAHTLVARLLNPRHRPARGSGGPVHEGQRVAAAVGRASAICAASRYGSPVGRFGCRVVRAAHSASKACQSISRGAAFFTSASSNEAK